jgi:hypothetical protein
LDKWRVRLNWDLARPFLLLEAALVPEQVQEGQEGAVEEAEAVEVEAAELEDRPELSRVESVDFCPMSGQKVSARR